MCDGLLDVYASFGQAPLANGFNTHDKFPLTLMRCFSCGHLQLRECVSPDILFGDYVYRAGAGDMQRAQFEELAYAINQHVGGLTDSDLIIDIGANDGALLDSFEHGTRLGVDPALVTGVPGLACSWNDAQIFAAAKVIVSTNTWAHLHDLHEATQKAADILTVDGVFVIQVPWARDMVMDNLYDTIYHEHQHYFTVRALEKLYYLCGLTIFQIDYLPNLHGGTIRVWANKGGPRADLTYWKTLEAFLVNVPFYKQFEAHATVLQHMLPAVFDAYGASAKGVMLLHLAGLVDRVDRVFDDTPTKVGKRVPCTTIPVRTWKQSPSRSTMLITAWNYADSIAKRLRSNGFGGKFVVPFPVPRYL